MPGGVDPVSMISQEAGNFLAEGEGVAQFFTGLSNEKKDKAALSKLKQPFYAIQPELLQNRNQAEAMAGGGIAPEQLRYMTQGAQQGLGAGLDAILRSGGSVNDASILTKQYNDQVGKIGAEDAAQHLANIQYFHKLNADVAAEKTKQWSVNEYQPYEAALKEIKQNIQTDEQNKWNGATTAISSMIGAGTGKQNAGLMGKTDPFTTPQATSAPALPPASSVGASTAEGGPSPYLY